MLGIRAVEKKFLGTGLFDFHLALWNLLGLCVYASDEMHKHVYLFNCFTVRNSFILMVFARILTLLL